MGVRMQKSAGAAISALGVGSERFINCQNIRFHSLPTTISTASGAKQRVLGFINVEVKYAGKIRNVKFFLVPSLQQELYLGIDFWQSFGIKPILIESISESTDSPINSTDVIRTSNSDPKQHDLTPDEKFRLENIIEMFPSSAKLGLGRTSLVTHKIDIGNASPVKQRHYPVSPAVQKEMYSELDRMLESGVIEVCENSPWTSPMALVRKANGKARLCLDARRLNELTKKDAYPLPIIDGLLSRLDNTKYISSLDLKDAFWQISL